jgi:hypothetical protein
MTQANKKDPVAVKKEITSEMRIVVEVDGNPVGFLNLDIDRLWPLINHRQREGVPVEWMDGTKFHSIMRAVIIKRLLARLQTHLYRTLGDEMVKAELDIESFTLKAEAAAQAFGKTKADIDALVSETRNTPLDFYAFFWEYLLDDRDVIDLRKEWKARSTLPR